jgi:hypothetical protein
MSQVQPYGYAPGQPPAVAPGYGGWGQHQVLTDRREPDTALVVVAWVLAVLTGGYALPWAIAVTRGKANHGGVALIDFLLGWTLVGWIVALVMACQAHGVIAAPVTMNVVVAQQFPHAQFGAPPAPAHATPPADWYPSPDGSGRRYWDGRAWTGYTTP